MAGVNLFSSVLRVPDEAKVILEAALVTTADSHDSQNRRVLAVVSHKEDWDLTEEASLFVCKYKTGPNGRPEELDVQLVLPIYRQFSVSIGQMRRGSSDIHIRPMVDQPYTVMTLHITPAEGPAQMPTYYTHDVQTLKAFVAECRRIKEVSDVETNTVINLASSTTHFSWLKPYIEKHATITTLTLMPQDLRVVNRPLLERLAPSYAGSMGDDQADAQIIRDEWIREKAKHMSRVGRRNISLRLGTFNVNGRMPSQDLSPWIRRAINIGETQDIVKHSGNKPELPPLTSISPLSFGEIDKGSFNWAAFESATPASRLPSDSKEKSVRLDLENAEDPDLLVLGFQELDLSTEALLYSLGTLREDAWILAITAALGEKAVNYEKLISRQLVGMLLVIFVKKNLKGCFSDMRTAVAGAGILGVMGNKGATAIRLTFTPQPSNITEKSTLHSPGSISLTFVNAHLAAFDEMVDKRNSDFHELSRKLNFERTEILPDSPNSEEISPQVKSTGELPPVLSIYETDILFWMGDLNYRVDLPDTSLRKILADEEWDILPKIDALCKFDQLKKSMQSRKAFHQFKEAPITHFPTYRFGSGLLADKMSYDLKRKPAWTDRILHMHGPRCTVEQLTYTGHPEVTLSDHRPASADFSIDVDLYDVEFLKDNVQVLLTDVQRLEGEMTREKGGLKISNTYIDFDTLSYGMTIEQTVSVQNISKHACAFRFVPIDVDAPIHPEWLSIQPIIGVLLPGEATDISLRAHVDNNIAFILNSRPKDLSGTLILHTLMGKDHFISVAGEYQYTCFANKLTKLTRLKGPIRSMESPSDLLPENKAINAPREIMRLINWMMTNGVDSDFMFVRPSDPQVMKKIIECLDTGEEFPYPLQSDDPDLKVAFASTLLRLLESLPDPIIPASLHNKCTEMTSRDEAFELLEELAPASVNVWISVTAFLHFICQTSKENKRAEQIARIMAPVLMRDDGSSLMPPISPAAKSHFLLYFIS